MKNLITILGPTATGKTRLASLIAHEIDGEIISADSRQVYKHLNIGTGKDYEDYIVDGDKVPYHLIDIIDPGEEYNIFRFKEDFLPSYNEIVGKNKKAILCGGTGMYLSAVLENYALSKITEMNTFYYDDLSDDQLRELVINKKGIQHNLTDLQDRERMLMAIRVADAKGGMPDTGFLDPLIIGINPGREIINERITARLKRRLKNGMIEEVENLIKSGVDRKRLIELGLEYRFITLYLSGQLNYNDMFQKLQASIRSFAKRQMTWFRKMQKEGLEITWLDSPDFSKATNLIRNEYYVHSL